MPVLTFKLARSLIYYAVHADLGAAKKDLMPGVIFLHQTAMTPIKLVLPILLPSPLLLVFVSVKEIT